MPFILRAGLKRRTNSKLSNPLNHRRGEFGSIKVADALPTGPLPDHKTWAYLFVTDVPDHLKEGFIDDVEGWETFQVGEVVTGFSGWTGEITQINEKRLTMKNVLGVVPSRPGEAITGSMGGSGLYNHFQYDLVTIRNWLLEPYQHSTRGVMTIEEADSPATLGETLTGTLSGATCTIDAQSGSSTDRMDVTNLVGVVRRGATITGATSGRVATVAKLEDADTLAIRSTNGPFTPGEIINGTWSRDYVDEFGDPQTEVVNFTADVVSEYKVYVGKLNVSNIVGDFQDEEPATTPTVNAIIGTLFEGDFLGRARRFIPLSSIPTAKLDELRHTTNGGQNWTDATFAQVKGLVKLRPADTDNVDKNDATLDAEGQTDVGAPT
jgi:hypothetical protein